MKKLLIDNRDEISSSEIYRLKKKSGSMIALVDNYNSLDILESLNSEKSIRQFLKEPLQYLETHLLSEPGLLIAKKQPSFDTILRFYQIDLTEFKRLVIDSRENLDYFIINISEEGNITIAPDETKLKEKAKLYLTSPAEIAEWESQQQFCDSITDYCLNKMKMHPSILNSISKLLDFDMTTRQFGGKGWYLSPKIEKVRQYLTLQKIKENKKKIS